MISRGKHSFEWQKREGILNLGVVNPWNHEKREVMQAMKTSGFKAKFDREEASRREVREGRGGMLYKLLYRVDNVG